MAANRKQRRGQRKVNANKEIAEFAKMVRSWTDKKIYDEMHKEATPELIDQVVEAMFDDIISTLAPKFEDEVMEVIIKTLHDWYKTPEDVILVNSDQEEMSAKMVETPKNPCLIGHIYRHYKGNYYKLVALALNSETREEMAVYQRTPFNGKYSSPTFVRSVKDFFSEVDPAKAAQYKPNQRYRFQHVEERKEA